MTHGKANERRYNSITNEAASLRMKVGKFVARTALIAAGTATFFTAITAAESTTGFEPSANASSPFDAANGAEKAWCRWPSRWSLCARTQTLANESLATAQEVAVKYNRGIHNGDADAYRHCLWSGLMTKEFGAATAQGFGDRHEYNEEQPDYERAMDLANNQIGRTLAQQNNDVGGACLQAMLASNLVVAVPFQR